MKINDRQAGPYFLGIDAGTTALKAALFDTNGAAIAISRQEYQLETPGPGIVELDAQVYWHALVRAVSAVMRESGVPAAQVAALSISSQGETLIPVDAGGYPLRKAIVWMDSRASQQARDFENELGLEAVYRHTGQPEISPAWPACKLRWLRENEPRTYDRSAKFLLLEDYLIYGLTGIYVTNYSIQASAMMVDLVEKQWWSPVLQRLGLSPDRFGELIPSGQIIGFVHQAAADEVGLSTATQVVSGGMDQALGAIGCKNIHPGVVSETTGGALAVFATLDQPRFDPAQRVPCYFHAVPGKYCWMPYGQTAGMALRWMRDQFYPQEHLAAQRNGIDTYDLMTAEAQKIQPGCDGLITLPHLEGAVSPEYNPAARAVFFGATLRHTRSHFARSILEAVAFMLKRNIDLLEDIDGSIGEIISLGGGSRSPLWLQIKADVLQSPVCTVESEETACLGAAMLAAAAVGEYSDLEECSRHMVRLKQKFLPNSELADVYNANYQRYIELYDRLNPMFHFQVVP